MDLASPALGQVRLRPWASNVQASVNHFLEILAGAVRSPMRFAGACLHYGGA